MHPGREAHFWSWNAGSNTVATTESCKCLPWMPSDARPVPEILEIPAGHASRGSCNTRHLLVRQVHGVLVQDLSSAALVWQPKLD
jgi:hypothetical protein